MLEKFTRMGEEDLMPNEKILFTEFASWFAEIKSLVIAVALILLSVGLLIYSLVNKLELIFYLFGGVLFLASLFLLISPVFSHYSVRYFITTFRVITRTGIFSKSINYVPYSKIQNIRIKKSISERIVDMGDIFIDVAGSSGIEVKIINIRDPEKIHNLILENMRKKEMVGNGL